MSLEFEEIVGFCRGREVDLILRASRSDHGFALVGCFDGYGEFFVIEAKDVEYIDFTPGVTVGELLLADFDTALRCTAKWTHLRGVVSGRSLILRSADADAIASARPQELGLVVANSFDFLPGKDWSV